MMPDRIQITHQDPMATPDFRALCAELNDWIERASDLHNCEAHDLMARARAAREADPEGEPPSPSGYAYRYRSPFGGTYIRFNGGEEVNGGRPIEAVPYWFAPPSAPATPPAPEPGEVEDVAQWLHAHALDCRVLGRDVLGNDWAEQCTRAATLLQQQCAPPAPEPGPTFQDAIKLAEGCHDYSGGHSGTEGEAWHGAIDTVVGVLKKATDGPWDSQTMAVFGVGAEAQAGEVEA